MSAEMPFTEIIIQGLATGLLIIGSWKDLKDKKVWKLIRTLFILLTLPLLPTINASISLAVLTTLAMEKFKLWTRFDTWIFLGLSLLHIEHMISLLFYLLPTYLAWATLYKKKWPEQDLPVVPVFLVLHLAMLFL